MRADVDLGATLAALEAVAREAPPSEVPDLVGGLERVKAIAWARLTSDDNGHVPDVAVTDRFLTAKEVHERTRLSVAYLYRHAAALPFFARRVGRKVLFSEARLTRWLAKRSP